jgi:hypothetical protein
VVLPVQCACAGSGGHLRRGTFGDSITDGATSTNDANSDWSSVLSRRLQAAKKNIAAVNQGISGNRVLRDGSGATPDKAITAGDLIAAYKQLAARAHEHGINVVGVTMTLCEGVAYQSPAGESLTNAIDLAIFR